MERVAMSLPLRSAPAATILIRVMVGAVFLAEGIQKFVYPAEVGAGRFAKIGIPQAELLGPFVGTVEVVCGTLVLLGLLTRWPCFRCSGSWPWLS